LTPLSELRFRSIPIRGDCGSTDEGLIDFQGGGLRDIGSELGAEFCHVVGEERGLVAGAGDGDVGEAGVEQVRVDAGIGVNEDAFGGKALGAVTGDGVAVVEMTMLAGVELDLAVVVEAGDTRPSGWIASMAARSRLATPSDLSGAVNWMRSPTENSRSISGRRSRL
jgi:hypothetical protein